MAPLSKKRYRDQISKPPRITIYGFISVCGSIASIIALVLYFTDWWENLKEDLQSLFVVSYLSILLFCAVLYIFLRETSKSHRFSETVYHTHYITHVIRDYLANTRREAPEIPLDQLLQDVVNVIASAYSILEGRSCRCSIKEVERNDNLKIKTVCRDSLSKTMQDRSQLDNHFLSENTDFKNVWYGLNGCSRYYRGINLKKIWSLGDYENSSFKIYGQPKRHSLFSFVWVYPWRLPYNSTIVFPIRFIPSGTVWPPGKEAVSEESPIDAKPIVWGFLCIDSRSSRAFVSQQSVELGATFSDALHILMDELDHMSVTNKKYERALNPELRVAQP